MPPLNLLLALKPADDDAVVQRTKFHEINLQSTCLAGSRAIAPALGGKSGRSRHPKRLLGENDRVGIYSRARRAGSGEVKWLPLWLADSCNC